jgi:hypothetical protein
MEAYYTNNILTRVKDPKYSHSRGFISSSGTTFLRELNLSRKPDAVRRLSPESHD